jgi:16S rRNA processing protein RimM
LLPSARSWRRSCPASAVAVGTFCVFNVADACITLGLVCIALGTRGAPGEAPPNGRVSRVAVGRLVGTFGLRGELRCRPGSFGEEALGAGRSYALAPEGDERHLQCVGVRRHHDRLLLSFEGVDTPEAARELIGAELFADRAAIELGRDEYFDADLIGLRLLDEAGKELGRVVGVEHYPAQDCLVVDPGRALVPLAKAFVRAIDLRARTVVMALPEGLL